MLAEQIMEYFILMMDTSLVQRVNEILAYKYADKQRLSWENQGKLVAMVKKTYNAMES